MYSGNQKGRNHERRAGVIIRNDEKVKGGKH
jgi:hypothetical protein